METRFILVGDKVHLMDENYEQVEVDRQIFGDQARWLVDGLDINVDLLQSGEPVIGEEYCNKPQSKSHAIPN